MRTATTITTATSRINMNDYVRDPAEITRLSFAAIRREADLSALRGRAVRLRFIGQSAKLFAFQFVSG